MVEAVRLLQKKLLRKKLDALLVSQPENRRYLSGYSVEDTSLDESSGLLLIPARSTPHLLTDFRYREQAETEAVGFEVSLYPKGLPALLKKLLPSLGIERLGFESHAIQHAKAVSIEKLLDSLGGEAIATSSLVEKLRLVKGDNELAEIRKSVRLNEKVFQKVYSTIGPGQTEKEVAHRIEQTMVEMGAEKPAFETIVGSGPNGALPHAVPSERKLREGEPIVIDMGLRLHGYCSDMTRTVVLGKPSDMILERIRLVRKAQLAAIQTIRAGITCREADQAARKIISKAGFGANFGHGLGHGVGLAVHEAPSLNSRSRKTLREGMVVTVEPGIYFPGWGGIRLENMVIVKKNGCEILNRDDTCLNL
jgi:Xaa-Pro aminopeptidase